MIFGILNKKWSNFKKMLFIFLFIKSKHIKLGKPDTQEHYPSKGEGTPAIP